MCCEDDIRSFHSGVFAYNLYLSDAWFVEFILINILVAPFAIPKKTHSLWNIANKIFEQ